MWEIWERPAQFNTWKVTNKRSADCDGVPTITISWPVVETIINSWFGKWEEEATRTNLLLDLTSIKLLSKLLTGVLYTEVCLQRVVVRLTNTSDSGTHYPYSLCKRLTLAHKFAILCFQKRMMSWLAPMATVWTRSLCGSTLLWRRLPR